MDHYYAELFGFMPPLAGDASTFFDEHSQYMKMPEAFDSPDNRNALPRRPTTLQFGTDTQFMDPKASNLAASTATFEGDPLSFEPQLSDCKISPLDIEKGNQFNGLDYGLQSPVSPSLASSGSSYARSLSACSPPPGEQIYNSDFGYKFQDITPETTPETNKPLLADLNGLEACLGSVDPWSTVKCREVETAQHETDTQTSLVPGLPFALYHDSKTSNISSMEDDTSSPTQEEDSNVAPPTILNPTPATASAGSSNPNKQPRVIRLIGEEHIDGQGLCYIYSDGTHCPKYIKGEAVNANWGITKAGRPRKRLAQACIACRHRKIKCTPGLPKCEQCKRSGKVCHFENAPRGNSAKARASSEVSSTQDSSAVRRASVSGGVASTKARQGSAFRYASSADFNGGSRTSRNRSKTVSTRG
ncbi:hypothetical protein KEM55_000660 [Ascosphaera atra]|nr:hypothetical protein KEM55_000660 [Ascosphaera atra]